MIKLTCCCQSVFEIRIQSAVKSGLIKNIIEDSGPDEIIPLNYIKKGTMKKIIEYLEYELNENLFNGKVESHNIREYVSLWESEYINIEIEELREIMIVANFLDIPQLLKLCSIKFASILYEKNSSEMRLILNEEDDLDHAEVEKLRKQYEEELKY